VCWRKICAGGTQKPEAADIDASSNRPPPQPAEQVEGDEDEATDDKKLSPFQETKPEKAIKEIIDEENFEFQEPDEDREALGDPRGAAAMRQNQRRDMPDARAEDDGLSELRSAMSEWRRRVETWGVSKIKVGSDEEFGPVTNDPETLRLLKSMLV
jgi:hypothetical protein